MIRIKEKILKLIESISNVNRLNDMESKIKRHVSFSLLQQKMIDSVLTSQEKGVVDESEDGEQYVVSLTTHGARIERVFQAIESIFLQSRKANKVVLYLSDKEFQNKELPIILQKQMERGLLIRYVKDLGPYTKLIPALRDFPEANIITIDDDHIYPVTLIDRLIRAHHTNPISVCSVNACLINIKEGVSSHPQTPFSLYYPETYTSSPHHLALGYAGILYPPHTLPEEVFNENIFHRLCPRADDIWFKAMELLQGTPVLRLPTSKQEMMNFWNSEDPTYQNMGLKNVNVYQGKNYDQLKTVFDHYKLYDKLIEQ